MREVPVFGQAGQALKISLAAFISSPPAFFFFFRGFRMSLLSMLIPRTIYVTKENQSVLQQLWPEKGATSKPPAR